MKLYKKAYILSLGIILVLFLTGCDFFKQSTTTKNSEEITTNIPTTSVTTSSDDLSTNITTEPSSSVTTPVYQGMEIYNSIESTNLSIKLSTNRSGSLDDSRPIIELIEEDMNLSSNNEIEYFSAINSNVFIVIRIFNPSGQAILRFTLNGTIYQSFQFYEGSDSENLILRVNSGSVHGIKEFTIDEIKYVENGTNEIKDAVFDGERTVKLGITYTDLPYANLFEPTINATSIKFNANVIDQASLIDLETYSLTAYLYDGNKIVEKIDINIGENNVRFSKLQPETTYQYVIVTAIDILDGNGLQVKLLNIPVTIETISILEIDNIVPTQDSVTFDITVTDTDEVGTITAIELYKGETLVETLTDLSVREFTGLLSNNEYTIRVTYTYDLNDGEGEQELVTTETVTTLAKATPEVVVDNFVPTQDSVAFDITVTDTDEVGTITAIELYQGETLIEALTDLSLRTFSDLLSNNIYQIKVTYTYDLKDGVGEKELVITEVVTTLANATPEVIVDNVVPTQDSVTFDINITDQDEVGLITAIELYQGETLIETLTDLNVRTFTNLMSNNEYQINVTYSFNLNDGVGEQNYIIKETFTTVSKSMPEISLSDYAADDYELNINIEIMNYDDTLLSITYELYDGEELIDSNLNGETVFNNLLSNTNYIIKVYYTYDLNDGRGIQSNALNFDILIGYFGQGTAVSPYKIYTLNEFLKMSDYADSYFVLMNDIDLSDDFWIPIPTFQNHFDGQFYKITGLNMVYIEGVTNYGLFGSISINSSVRNLIIENAQINIDSSSNIRAGILAGVNMGIVEQVGVTGKINISSTWLKAGGLVASNDAFVGAQINNSYALVNMIISSTSRIEVGGLLGSSSSPVYNSYAKGNIDIVNEEYIDIYAGGLIGFHNTKEIVNSFSYVDFTVNKTAAYKTTRLGYLIGHTNGGSSIYNSYGFIQQQFITDNPDFVPYDWMTNVIDINIVTSSWLTNTLTWPDSIWYFDFINSGLGLTPLLVDPLFLLTSMDVNPESVNIDFFISENIVSNSLIVNVYKESVIITLYQDLTNIMIDGLLSNNQYVIEVIFEYSYMGESDIFTFNLNYDIVTESKSSPEIEIANVVPTQDTVIFDVNIIDTDEVGNISAIELYQNEILIETLNNLSIRTFTNLLANKEYQIKATYRYDLNDGIGVRETLLYYEFKTLAKSISIVSLDLGNINNPLIGEDVILKIKFLNPSFVPIESVEINNVRYDFDTVVITNATINLGNFADSGYYNFIVSSITYMSKDKEIIELFITNNEISINVINTLQIIDIYAETPIYLQTSFVDGSNPGYIILKLDNPGNYNLYSLSVLYSAGYNDEFYNVWIEEFTYTYSQEEILFIDSFHVKVLWKGKNIYRYENPYERFEVQSFKYGLAPEETTTRTQDYSSKEFFVMNSFVPINVYSYTDINNMQHGYVYVLNNDIDLNGISWTPKDFEGIFNGNGYAISNLMFDTDIITSGELFYFPGNPEPVINYKQHDFGLFGNVKGFFCNLKVSNIYFDISIINAVDYFGVDSLRAGAVAGYSESTIFNNIEVSGVININASINQVHIMAGGITSFADEINDSMANLDINIISVYYVSVGGLAGFVSNSIIGNYVESDIFIESSTISAGGLIGNGGQVVERNTFFGLITIRNATRVNAGLLIGYSSLKVSNNLVKYGSALDVQITNTSSEKSYIGGLIGSTGASYVTNNILYANISILNVNEIYTGIFVGKQTGVIPNSGMLSANIYSGNVTIISYGDIYFNLETNVTVLDTIGENYFSSTSLVNLNSISHQIDNTKIITFEQENSALYYINLGFKTSIWDFTGLDTENNIYPNLF